MQRLSGADRRAAMTPSDGELGATRWRAAVVDYVVEIEPAIEEDRLAGMKSVVDHLERNLTRKFPQRFDEAVNQLRDGGIAVEALEPIPGWFYLQILLTPEGRERAVAAMTQGVFVIADIRRVCARLFADLQRNEATARSGDISATPHRQGEGQDSRGPRRVAGRGHAS